VLALGGSASTDGGAGMLAALGAVFLDADGHALDPTGARLGDIAHVDTRNLADLSRVELVVAADVTNPLLGADGAAAVFGPQKGADPDQVTALDEGLARLVQLLPAKLGGDTAALAAEPGAGAAGGLGFACRWLGGRRVAGAGFFLDLLGFDEALAACDAVVTGEGCMDGQTLNGKLPAVVARRSAPRPVYAVVGQSRLRDEERRQLGLEGIEALSALTTADPSVDAGLSRALATRAGERIGRELRTALHLGLPSR
jgi:glycerate kinase